MARISCCACGFVFSVPLAFNEARTEDHKPFYCPACGESQYYPQKTDTEKLKDDNLRLKRMLEIKARVINNLEEANVTLERRGISQKGATTKLRKQVNESRKED